MGRWQWEEDDKKKWLGAPPSLEVTFDCLYHFIISVTFQSAPLSKHSASWFVMHPLAPWALCPLLLSFHSHSSSLLALLLPTHTSQCPPCPPHAAPHNPFLLSSLPLVPCYSLLCPAPTISPILIKSNIKNSIILQVRQEEEQCHWGRSGYHTNAGPDKCRSEGGMWVG